MKDSAKGMTAQALSWQGLWEAFRAKVIGRKFVQDVGVLTVANAVGVVLSFIQVIVVARWLGPKLYGVAALVMAYPSILFGFIDTRSADASVKYLGECEAKQDRARALAVCKLGYTVDIAIAMLAFMLVAATAWWAEERIVHTPNTAPLIILYAAAFLPRSLAGTSSAVMATLGRFPTLAKVEGLCAAVRTTLVVGLVWWGYGVAGVIWGNAFGLAFQGLLLGLIAYPVVKGAWGQSWLSGRWHALRGKRREIAGFLVYNNLSTLTGIVRKQLDVVLLGFFRGPVEVGYYRLAKSIVAVPGYLGSPLNSVSYVRLSRMWGEGRWDEMWSFVRRSTLFVGVPLAVLLLASIPIVESVVLMTVGSEYGWAVPIAQILLVSAALSICLFCFPPLILTWGHMRFRFLVKLVTSLLMLFGIIIFVPRYGATGLAWILLLVSLGAAAVSISLVTLWGKWAAKTALEKRDLKMSSWTGQTLLDEETSD